MTHSIATGHSSEQRPRGRGRKIRVIAAAGAAVAVAAGLAACGSNSSPAASTSTSAAASSAAPEPGRHHHDGVFGTIATENGNTWTLTKRDGTTETVTITPTTAFGTARHPATQSQLVVGDTVMVRGQVSGDTITATRIAQGHHDANPPAPSSTAPTN